MGYTQINPDTTTFGILSPAANTTDDDDGTFASGIVGGILVETATISLAAQSDDSRYWAGLRVVWEVNATGNGDATDVGFTISTNKTYTLASSSGAPSPSVGVKNTDFVVFDNDDTRRVAVDNAISLTLTVNKILSNATIRVYELDFLTLPRVTQVVQEG